MSSFATMYSFAKKHGLRYFVTQEQADQLSYYFEPEQLSLNVIDKSLPWYNRLYWEFPWDKLDNVNFDYSRMEEEELHKGRAINIGDYPNQIRDMVPHLQDIRAMFSFRARFRERAEDLLQAAGGAHEEEHGGGRGHLGGRPQQEDRLQASPRCIVWP